MMNTVKTREFALVKNVHFKLLITRWFKYYILRVLGYASLLIIANLLLFDSSRAHILGVISAIIYFFAVVLNNVMWFWRHVNSRDNKNLYTPGYIIIDTEDMHLHGKDGSYARQKLSNLIRVERILNYYLVYYSKMTGYWIPLDAFTSEDDRKQFEAILRQYNLL